MFSGILHGITHNDKSAEACADKNAEITCKSYMGKSCHFREYSSNNKYFEVNIEVYVLFKFFDSWYWVKFLKQSFSLMRMKKHYVHKLFVMQTALPNQNKNISVKTKSGLS